MFGPNAVTPVFQPVVVLLFLVAFHCACLTSQSGNKPPDASQTPASPVMSQQLRDSVEDRLELFGLDVDETRCFFERFKAAVAREDRQVVASMIEYPIAVHLRARKEMMEDAGQFVEHYDEILTERVRQAVLDQSFEKLFVSWRGVMIGTKGEVWLGGICRDDECSRYDLRIITINN